MAHFGEPGSNRKGSASVALALKTDDAGGGVRSFDRIPIVFGPGYHLLELGRSSKTVWTVTILQIGCNKKLS